MSEKLDSDWMVSNIRILSKIMFLGVGYQKKTFDIEEVGVDLHRLGISPADDMFDTAMELLYLPSINEDFLCGWCHDCFLDAFFGSDLNLIINLAREYHLVAREFIKEAE